MSHRPRLLVVCIATNRYVEFIAGLLDSLRRWWTAPGVDLAFLVLTNREDSVTGSPDLLVRRIEHRPWPAMTLFRYHAFLEHRDILSTAHWVVYIDADMRVVNDLGDRFLCRSFTTLHPGYARAPASTDRPFERDPASRACVSDPRAQPYFYGGVQGGESADFLAMCEDLKGAIDADAAIGITARWHDESHLNRYRRDHPPIRILDPSFAFPDQPEQARTWGLLDLEPVILALTKDHVAYRYGLASRIALRARSVLGSIARRAGSVFSGRKP